MIIYVSENGLMQKMLKVVALELKVVQDPQVAMRGHNSYVQDGRGLQEASNQTRAGVN